MSTYTLWKATVGEIEEDGVNIHEEEILYGNKEEVDKWLVKFTEDNKNPDICYFVVNPEGESYRHGYQGGRFI